MFVCDRSCGDKNSEKSPSEHKSLLASADSVSEDIASSLSGAT